MLNSNIFHQNLNEVCFFSEHSKHKFDIFVMFLLKLEKNVNINFLSSAKLRYQFSFVFKLLFLFICSKELLPSYVLYQSFKIVVHS